MELYLRAKLKTCNITDLQCTCKYLCYCFRFSWILLKKLGWQKKLLSNIEEVLLKKRYSMLFSPKGLYEFSLTTTVYKSCQA